MRHQHLTPPHGVPSTEERIDAYLFVARDYLFDAGDAIARGDFAACDQLMSIAYGRFMEAARLVAGRQALLHKQFKLE